MIVANGRFDKLHFVIHEETCFACGAPRAAPGRRQPGSFLIIERIVIYNSQQFPITARLFFNPRH